MNSSEIFKIVKNISLDLEPLDTQKDFKLIQTIKKNCLKPEDFYKIKGKLYPYCYLKNMVLIEIYDDSQEFFNMYEVQKKVEFLTKKLDDLLKEKKFLDMFFIISPCLRWKTFLKLYQNMSNKQAIECFDYIYSSLDYGFDIKKDILLNLFEKRKVPKDKNTLITIYRGETPKSNSYKKVLSWTTDFEIAKFFATRFHSQGIIIKASIKKGDILHKIDSRNESEVLVFSDKLINIKKINYQDFENYKEEQKWENI